MEVGWGRMMLLKPRCAALSVPLCLPPSSLPGRSTTLPRPFVPIPFIFFEVHTFLPALFSSLPHATLLIDYSDRGISFAEAF